MGLLYHEHPNMSKSMSKSTDIGFIGIWHVDIGGDRVLGRATQRIYDVRLVYCNMVEIEIMQKESPYLKFVEVMNLWRIQTLCIMIECRPYLLCLNALRPNTPINQEDYNEEIEQSNTLIELNATTLN